MLLYLGRPLEYDAQPLNNEHVSVNRVRYGNVMAEPLTKEQLLQALIKIQLSEANMDYLLQMDGYEFSDGHELEAATKCANELYSDALLEKLNKEMSLVYAADSMTPYGMMSALAMDGEATIGHGIELLPKIWEKPAVCVGSRIDFGGSCGPYCDYCEWRTYIDVNGDVFVLRCLSIIDSNNVLILETRELVDCDDELSLDGLSDMFPEEFRDFWNV